MKAKNIALGVACVALLVLILGIGWGVAIAEAGARNAHAATAEKNVFPEQVEIFMSGVGDEGRTALMEKLDTWLNSHKGKVEVTGRTMSCNEHAIIASIWYKLKTD